MNVPFIPYVNPVISLHCGAPGVFSPEECDAICKMAKHKEFMAAKVGGGANGGVEDPAVRRTDIVWLNDMPSKPNDPLSPMEIYRRINRSAGGANYHHFQLDLSAFDGLQFGEYKAENKGHYDFHFDTMLESHTALFRKLSVVIGLTDPDTYEGGDLVISTDANPDKQVAVRLKKGDAIFFQSFVPHKVTPVTKGVRRTLTTWIMGPRPQ